MAEIKVSCLWKLGMVCLDDIRLKKKSTQMHKFMEVPKIKMFKNSSELTFPI